MSCVLWVDMLYSSSNLLNITIMTEEKNYLLKSNNPPCIIGECKRDSYGGSRGMCMNHYAVRQALVKRGKATWDELESIGEAKPKLTREGIAARRKRAKEVPLRREWSMELQQFIYYKI